MKSRFAYALTAAVVGMVMATAGCAGRGEFTFNGDTCPGGEQKVSVPAAAIAVYYDSAGNIVGTKAENMTPTTKNVMCPADIHLPPPSGQTPPTFCQAGQCTIPLGGGVVICRNQPPHC